MTHPRARRTLAKRAERWARRETLERNAVRWVEAFEAAVRRRREAERPHPSA